MLIKGIIMKTFFIKLITKHPILLCLIILLGIPASLNYSGMCISQKRWLDEKEFEQAIAEKYFWQANSYNSHRGSNFPEKISFSNGYPVKDGKEFLEKFPDCCKLGRRPLGVGDGLWRPSYRFIYKMIGAYYDSSVVVFEADYTSEQGTKTRKLMTFQSAVNNCGEAWSPF
jgi:hypothetical protein